MRLGARVGHRHLLRAVGHTLWSHHAWVGLEPHALHTITVAHHWGLLSHHRSAGGNGLETLPTTSHPRVTRHLGKPHVALWAWGTGAHVGTHLAHHVVHVLVLKDFE